MRRFKPPHPCAFPAVLNAAWATTGYGLGGLPAITAIAVMGHSRIAQQSIRYAGTPGQNYYAANGWLTHAMQRLGWPVSVVRDGTSLDYDFGASGYKIEQVQSVFPPRLDTALPSVSDKASVALLIDCITNNIGADESAATIKSRLDSLISDLVARGWAKSNILLCTDQPRLDGAGEADRLAVRLEVNDYVRSGALGVDFIEFANLGDTGDGYMDPTLVDTIAPGHDLAPIASQRGEIVAEKLVAKYRIPEDTFSVGYPLFPDAALTGKNDFTGTPVSATPYGATAGSVVPPGWRPTGFSGATFSTAVVDHPAITGAKAVEIDVSVESTNIGGMSRITAINATNYTNAGFVAGDVIDAAVEIFVGSATIRRLQALLAFDGSASLRDASTVLWSADYNYNSSQVISTPSRIVLRTPPLTLGTGATFGNVNFSGNWLGKITVGRMLIRKIS